MNRISIVTMRRAKWSSPSGIVDRGPEAEAAVQVEAGGAGVVAEDAGTTDADTVGMAEAAEAVVKK